MNAHLRSLLARLNRRPAEMHKGDCGRVLVAAGSTGMTGAAYLAAESALRCGAGLVLLAVPAQLCAIIEIKATCVISMPVASTDDGAFAPEAADELADALEACSVALVGPGIGTRRATAEFVHRLLDRVRHPVVIDADALNIMAGDADALAALGERVPVVLTPHPGEFARLTGLSTAQVQRDRSRLASRLAQSLKAVVVLKGRGTVVTDGRREYINTTGNPGMATAGSGDVLAGMIGAFIGQGVECFDAACLGVERHGAAGDVAAERKGALGMTAEDILSAVPEVLKEPSSS